MLNMPALHCNSASDLDHPADDLASKLVYELADTVALVHVIHVALLPGISRDIVSRVAWHPTRFHLYRH
jgi:hypothetical protein